MKLGNILGILLIFYHFFDQANSATDMSLAQELQNSYLVLQTILKNWSHLSNQCFGEQYYDFRIIFDFLGIKITGLLPLVDSILYRINKNINSGTILIGIISPPIHKSIEIYFPYGTIKTMPASIVTEFHRSVNVHPSRFGPRQMSNIIVTPKQSISNLLPIASKSFIFWPIGATHNFQDLFIYISDQDYQERMENMGLLKDPAFQHNLRSLILIDLLTVRKFCRSCISKGDDSLFTIKSSEKCWVHKVKNGHKRKLFIKGPIDLFLVLSEDIYQNIKHQHIMSKDLYGGPMYNYRNPDVFVVKYLMERFNLSATSCITYVLPNHPYYDPRCHVPKDNNVDMHIDIFKSAIGTDATGMFQTGGFIIYDYILKIPDEAHLSWSFVFAPLGWPVLTASISFLLIVSVSINRLSRQDRVDGNEKRIIQYTMGWSTAFGTTTRAILGQNISFVQTGRLNFLLMIWVFYTFLLTESYKGSVYSFLMIKRVDQYPKTFQELDESGFTLFTVKSQLDGQFTNFSGLLGPDEGMTERIIQKLNASEGILDDAAVIRNGFLRVLLEKNAVLVVPGMLLDQLQLFFMYAPVKIKYARSAEPAKVETTWEVTDVFMRNELVSTMQHIRESGAIDYFRSIQEDYTKSKFFIENFKVGVRNSFKEITGATDEELEYYAATEDMDTDRPKVLTLQKVAAVFIVLIIGIVVAILSFSLEVVKKQCSKLMRAKGMRGNSVIVKVVSFDYKTTPILM